MKSMSGGVGQGPFAFDLDHAHVQLIAALGRQGVVLSEPSDQDDQAYAPGGWSYGMPKIGVAFGRLRTEPFEAGPAPCLALINTAPW